MREPLTITTRIFNPALKGQHVMIKGERSGGSKLVYSGRVQYVTLNTLEIMDFESREIRSVTLDDFDGKGRYFKSVRLFRIGATVEIADEKGEVHDE